MNNSILKKLFYELLRIRMIEEEIAIEYAKQQMRCPTHLCIGHEAIHVGVCACLEKLDYVLSNHRSHGHYLAKGGDLKGLIAELFGKATGCSKGWGGSQHLIDLSVNFLGSTPIVGGTIPVAVGSSWASQMQKEHAVTVVFFGDAATEEGVFYESLNFATLKNLPVLFVCENNLYSIFTHIGERQPKRTIQSLAKAHGMYTGNADGNDVMKVYKASKKAIEHIQKGKGPAFLEFFTYRYREHCGPHFEAKGQRDNSIYEKWSKRDPVTLFTNYLTVKKIMSNQNMKYIRSKIEKEIEEAFHYAKMSPFPRWNKNTDYVFKK